jgi:hypothetical protein
MCSCRERPSDLGDTAEGTVERKGDAVRRGRSGGFDADDRQIEFAMMVRHWHAVGVSVQFDNQHQPRLRVMLQAHNAEAAHFEQPGQWRWWGGKALGDVHLVVRNQVEAARQQAQDEVGLARSRWADQQDSVSVPRYAASVQAPPIVHDPAV